MNHAFGSASLNSFQFFVCMHVQRTEIAGAAGLGADPPERDTRDGAPCSRAAPDRAA